MGLSFPNASRSYDASQQRVRFWAYDSDLEIPFFVEAAALCQMDPKTGRDETGLLNAFDAHRTQIFAAAERVYRRHRKGSYLLVAADMK
jgi:hypothetical protein